MRRQNSRGSALVLVVGLLTVIALLGTTFFFFSRLDAQQSAAVADKASVIPLVDSQVEAIRTALATDMGATPEHPYPYGARAGDHAPWGGTFTFTTTDPSALWSIYMDAGRCPAVATYTYSSLAKIHSCYNDAWLGNAQNRYITVNTSSNHTVMTGRPSDPLLALSTGTLAPLSAQIGGSFATTTPYLATPGHPWYTYSGAYNATTKKWDWRLTQTSVSAGSGAYTSSATSTANGNAAITPPTKGGAQNALIPYDTDCNDWADTLLLDTGVNSKSGMSYYIATQVIDTNSLLCVNTAGDNATAQLTQPVSQANVGLKAFLDASLSGAYTAIHQGRCGGNNKTLTEYMLNCGMRLGSPSSGYAPFAVGDEPFIRYMATSGNSHTGRLYDTTYASPTQNLGTAATRSLRQFLTTYNCVRARPRYCDSASDRLLYLYDSATTPAMIYQNIKRILNLYPAGGAQGSTTDQMNAAGAFTVACWKYMGKVTDASGFSFPCPDDATKVFYPLPDTRVFVTEVFAKVSKDASGVVDRRVHAIELTNYGSASASLSGYTLQNGTSSIVLTGSIAAGAKRTIYDTVGAPDAAFFTPPSDVQDVTSGTIRLDLSGGKEWVLVNGSVPLDYAVIASSDYPESSCANGNSYATDLLRDDTAGDYRYMIGDAYKTPIPKGAVTHNLGAANGVLPADVATAAPNPLKIDWSNAPTTLTNLGDVQKLLLCGPRTEASGTTRIPLTKDLALRGAAIAADKASRHRARLDFRPYPNPTPTLVTPAGAGFSASGDPNKVYPNVPPTVLLNEFFTLLACDSTRPDEPTRQYGLVNINTAPVEVLRRLPWPQTITLPGATPVTISLYDASGQPNAVLDMMVEYIRAYRAKDWVRSPTGTVSPQVSVAGLGTRTFTRNYFGTSATDGNARGSATNSTNITNLRYGLWNSTMSGVNEGFVTPGEIAIPLTDFMYTLAGYTTYTAAAPAAAQTIIDHPDFVEFRDCLYRAVSNVITTRSDTYAVLMTVALCDVNATSSKPTVSYTWNYVAFLDRSNCIAPGDKPMIMLFTEIK